MKLLLQRVKEASVKSEGLDTRRIGRGLLVLVGIEKNDTHRIVSAAARKVSSLRIFEDKDNKMNLDVFAAGGKILSVPQFTLCANIDKGNRPSFDGSEKPEIAEGLWRFFNDELRVLRLRTEEGYFGRHMDVQLINDGPVTFFMEV